MSWSWLSGITSAALVSMVATMPARADCYCPRNLNSNERTCGEVVKKDDKSVWLRVEGYPQHLDPAMVNLADHTYCGQGDQDPARLPGAPGTSRPPPLPTFGIVGSNTIGEELMPALIAGFGQQQKLEITGSCPGSLTLKPPSSGAVFPETAINCEALGTHFGIPALNNGRAEIAMLSRRITDAERASVVNPVEHVLALDGVVVIVSPDNPLAGLTLDQIGQIFAGEIKDWSQLGRQAGPINLYMRNENSGTRDTFENLVMKPRDLALASGQVFSSSSQLSATVADDPNGIGFVGYAYRHTARALDITLSCGITHHPTEMAIKSEDYPLTRRLFLYTGKSRSALATKLLEYALSDEAQPIISKTNFIDLSIANEGVSDSRDWITRYADPRLRPSEPDLDFDPAIFAKLQRSTKGAERLSISFRFQSDSEMLDSRAREDVRRLATYLNTDASGRQVLLAGFTDAKGRFGYNLALSRRRAVIVREALAEAGVDRRRLAADGFSELLPVVCNGADDKRRLNDRTVDDEVRMKNRRVEAWLLP
jgi:phosphate transport system substrate-binding protein